MPKPKPKKTSSAPAAPEPTRRSARAAEASAAANAPLCALAGALDEEGNFVGTWSLPDGSDPAEFSYEVETAPFDDDGSFTLTLAGAFVFGGAPRRDEMALTVRGAAISGLGRSEIGDYRVAGAVEGDAWRLQKLPPLPKASDSEDDAPPPPPPPKHKPRRSSTTDVRELPPPDGAKLFVRWKGDDGALGSGPDGYYRCALVDGDVVGADPGIWEGDPVAFDPARDDWCYAENPTAPPPSSLAAAAEEPARRGRGPDEVPLVRALSDAAALNGLHADGERVVGFAAPTEALLKAAHGACCAALSDGDGEAWENVKLARSYYDHWRPETVKVILLAESHVYTAPEDRVSKRLSPAAIAALRKDHGYDGPAGYLQLVHCLGYGEPQLVSDGQGNKGTPQFWQLLAAAGRDVPDPWVKDSLNDVLQNGTPRLADRIATKLQVLKRLKERGVWLLDTCVVGWYIQQEAKYKRSASTGEVHRVAKQRPPKRLKRPALLLSWELYMKHVIRQVADEGALECLVPLGKEVWNAVGVDRFRAAAGAARVADPLPAPNAWLQGGYGPYFSIVSRICREVCGADADATAAPADAPLDAPEAAALVTPEKARAAGD